MKSLALLLMFAAAGLGAEPGTPVASAQTEQFELSVRPLLAGKCYGCHTDSKSGGLQLDSREHMLAGGNSGPAIKPGDPDGSLLMQAVRQTHAKLKMPPGGKLKDEQIEGIAAWIKAGAVWPAGLRKRRNT